MVYSFPCPASFESFGQSRALSVASPLSVSSHYSAHRQGFFLFVVHRLTAEISSLLGVVFPPRAYPDIPHCVWSNIAISGHAVIIRIVTSLVKFAALDPDVSPFFKRHKEGNAAHPCSGFMVPVALAKRVFLIPSADCSNPLGSASIGLSHWFLPRRSMVRGGIGVATPLLSRSYHGFLEKRDIR
jgi:hypothetical protein